MNNFHIIYENISKNELHKMKQDNILAKQIVQKDILNAKLNNTKYNDFKNDYRPVGDDTYLKKIWNTLNTHNEDDWIIIFCDF